MKTFDTMRLRAGDVICRRSKSSFGRTIRAILGCYTNHNGLVVEGELHRLAIGEAVQPVSRVTTLAKYERDINEGRCLVRVLRFDRARVDGEEAARYFVQHLLGKKYPVSVARLWVYRFVNNLPWKIKGPWCTNLVWDAWKAVVPNIWIPPTGKRKKNPTPRTIENRLIAGVLRDVTDEVLIDA
jgi:hypothetical protein